MTIQNSSPSKNFFIGIDSAYQDALTTEMDRARPENARWGTA